LFNNNIDLIKVSFNKIIVRGIMLDFINILNPWWSDSTWRQKGVNRILKDNILTSATKTKYITIIKGARQCGKTFLIKQIVSHLIESGTPPSSICYFLFEDLELVSLVEKEPQSFKKYIENESKKFKKYYVFLDEFQRVSGLTNLVKIFYEADSNIKWVLSGSSQPLLSDRISESLLGRTETYILHPFSFGELFGREFEEIAMKFRTFFDEPETGFKPLSIAYNETKGILNFLSDSSLNSFLLAGGFPQSALALQPMDSFLRLKELKQVYIERDIVQMLKLEKWREFENLMTQLALQTGQLVNYSNLQTDVSISFETLKKCIAILQNTYVAHILPNFTVSRLTSIKKMPKIFYEDVGLRNFMAKTMDNIALAKEIGPILETFTFNQLSKYNSWIKNDMGKIYFWRSTQGNEVDFIWEHGRTRLPVEVKAGNVTSVARGMHEFMKRSNMRNMVVFNKKNFERISSKEAEFFLIPHIFAGLLI
jgi:predicted AAA+ superfamily ATPase